MWRMLSFYTDGRDVGRRRRRVSARALGLFPDSAYDIPVLMKCKHAYRSPVQFLFPSF